MCEGNERGKPKAFRACTAKKINRRLIGCYYKKNTGIRLEWIENAGHNSNTDAPETVNRLIEEHVIRCEAEIKPEKKEEGS